MCLHFVRALSVRHRVARTRGPLYTVDILRCDTCNYVGVDRAVTPTPLTVLGVLFGAETSGAVRICDTPLEPCQNPSYPAELVKCIYGRCNL